MTGNALNSTQVVVPQKLELAQEGVDAAEAECRSSSNTPRASAGCGDELTGVEDFVQYAAKAKSEEKVVFLLEPNPNRSFFSGLWNPKASMYRVYSVPASFVQRHPGGTQSIKKFHGKVCPYLNFSFHGPKSQKLWKNFEVAAMKLSTKPQL